MTPEEIADAFKTFYQALYNLPEVPEQEKIDSYFRDLTLPRIGADQLKTLNAPFLAEEVNYSIDKLKLNKAPGPDGFNNLFFKVFKGDLLEHLTEMFNSFANKNPIPGELLKANIITIPKEGKDLELVSSFRPISLLNTDIKVYSAVLAERIKKLLPLIIHRDQTGYVPGRSSTDNVRRLINVLDYVKKKGAPFLTLSLDAEKAFDRVRWSFMKTSLEIFGFGGRIVDSILALYTSPSARVVGGGFTSKWFNLYNGTRQGCPLSPLLYLITVEPMAAAIRQNQDISGLKVGKRDLKINLYADDIIVTIENPDTSLVGLMSEIDRFSEVSGYKLNYDKTVSLPLTFIMQRDEVKVSHKDPMNISDSLAVVEPVQPHTGERFNSVGGLSKHIAALKEMVVFPLLYPEIFERFKIQPPRGCLFYGPPGTGKTLVARALANECSVGDRRVSFFMRKGADCLSEWVGESEKQLRLLFDQAYQMRPSIIFFDEIDGLAPVRSSRQDQIHSSIVSTLLALMDGLDSRGEVVVIGATNRLDSIDPALRRPGRFDREFRFCLPDSDARLEILKIHTRDWTPKLSEMFLNELAEKCVGYCGADIKSLCAEATLCALRRRYPQIYTTTEKLQLDVSSIQITARDFVVAMQKIVPASQRAVVSPGQALSSIIQPLLQNTLLSILDALKKVFPHVEEGLKKRKKSDLSSHLMDDDDLLCSDEEGPSVYENGLLDNLPNKQKDNRPFFLQNMNANRQPTSYRPRFLIAGKPGLGQSSHLAPAVIHALEKFTVYTLDLAVLFGNSGTSPEETCAQLFREAKRTSPSILYIPHIHLWWKTVSSTLKATFMTLLQDIPSFSPILLLATSDLDYSDLPLELQDLFIEDYGEVYHVNVPSNDQRRAFFEDLILNQAAKPPVSKQKAGFSSSKYAASTPTSGPVKKKYKKENSWSSGCVAKRRKLEPNGKDEKIYEENESDSDLETPRIGVKRLIGGREIQVDHQRLQKLLNYCTLKSSGYTVLQLEKLYAFTSQCIYTHHQKCDKTILMKKQVGHGHHESTMQAEEVNPSNIQYSGKHGAYKSEGVKASIVFRNSSYFRSLTTNSCIYDVVIIGRQNRTQDTPKGPEAQKKPKQHLAEDLFARAQSPGFSPGLPKMSAGNS
ncbi:ATPase family AAA domain-containing protein 2-like [Pelodytes ibericus]